MAKNLKAKTRKRKNFLPTLIVTILLWLATLSFIFLIDPTGKGAVPVFFIIFFLTLFFTFAIIFSNSRRGLLSSVVLTLFLLLRYFGVGHILNFFLLLGIVVAFEIYFSNGK